MIPIDQKTILLVEDEAIIAMTERKTLEQAGYSVIVAYDGQTAIQNVDKSPDGRPVDLVLMDIDLGKGMDGTEAASASTVARQRYAVVHCPGEHCRCGRVQRYAEQPLGGVVRHNG